jgi:hypothetical protein
MPVWRCPYCATPQPESSRCWVCRRSTTSCATCRHYRRGVAGGLGLCGRDRRHLALTGHEMRACWVAAPQAPEHTARRETPVGPGRRHGGDPILGRADSERAPRTFVLVEPTDRAAGVDRMPDADGGTSGQAGSTIEAAIARAARAAPATGHDARVPGTWWLWGDPEPWPEP